MYRCVVATLACPRSSCTARMSAPPSSRCVANECRRVCGVTRRPGRNAPVSFHKRTDIAGTERPSLPVEEQGRGALGRHRRGGPRGIRPPPPRRRRPTAAPRAPSIPCPALGRARGEVDIDRRQARRLADADPGAVQQLEDRAVAQRDGACPTGSSPRRAGRGLHQDRASGARRTVGSRFDDLRPSEQRAGSGSIGPPRPPTGRTCGSRRPGGRSTRARSPSVCCCARKRRQHRLVGASSEDPARCEERGELQQVVPVGRDGVRGQTALQSQMVGERRDQAETADGEDRPDATGSSPASRHLRPSAARIVPATPPRRNHPDGGRPGCAGSEG